MILTAHSGSDHTPENSFEFIERCIDYQVDCLEIDIQIASDGTLYLSHDPLVDDANAPTLRDALTRIQNTSIQINCDLKAANCEMPVIELFEQMHLSHRFYLSGSVNLSQVPRKYRKQIFYNIENYFTLSTLETQINETQLESFCLYLKINQIEVVNLYYKLWSVTLEKIFTRYQLKSSLWTIETVADYFNYQDKVFNITSRCACACIERMKHDKLAKS